VAVTGWGQEEDKRRARDAGFDHHMVKPVEPGQILAALATVRRLRMIEGRVKPGRLPIFPSRL
jgi:DNA-binding response OmpR family regulator